MGDHETHGRDLAPGVPYDGEALEAGRRLFAQSCRFVLGAVRAVDLPSAGLPEVAFAGRSNVGKSSLVNALTGRSTLARTSNTPGRTRQINFFDLGGRLMLVDLPGYGFARASKKEIAGWTGLVRDYLKDRAELRRLCLLIDARHGFKRADHGLMELLAAAAVAHRVVLTKADKVTARELSARIAEAEAVLRGFTAALPQVLATSARDGAGVAELRADLAMLAS